jgi:hypothetical protein
MAASADFCRDAALVAILGRFGERRTSIDFIDRSTRPWFMIADGILGWTNLGCRSNCESMKIYTLRNFAGRARN